jgi:hypothetical protein
MARLNKHVAIARSGVYEYSPGALPGLGLSVPPEKKGQRSFGVFRPPEVLKRVKDLFTKLPVTLEHPPAFVDGNNFRDLVMGYTGDSVDIEHMPNEVDVRLMSTLVLADNEAINAYYRGIVEVSPGYVGNFVWDSGVSPTGEKYDIVMQDVTDVNHLALTRHGRGGKAACVLDSREVIVQKRKSNLFYAIYKKFNGVTDAADDAFVATLSDLVANNRKMDVDVLGEKVAKLATQVDYLPDTEGKTQLMGYVSDLMGLQEESDESAKQAGVMIGNLYATLDQQALASIAMDAFEESDTKEKGDKSDSDGEGESKPEELGDDKPGEDEPKKESEAPDEVEGSPNTAIDQPSIGPGDEIYAKKFSEQTPEERDFIWSELMEALKAGLLKQKEADPVVMAPKDAEEPAEDAPGHEEAESPEEEKKEAEEQPEEEKKEADRKGALDSVSEPQYPGDTEMHTEIAAAPTGIDLDTLMAGLKHKGGK